MRIKNAKTKILSTIGPATSSVEMMTKLIEKGVDGFRLNFSHGSYQMFEEIFNNIKITKEKTGMPLSVLVDLQGPKIRVGELEEAEYELIDGESIEITTERIRGNAKKISATYDPLPRDAQKGDCILIDDGLLRLEVTGKNETSVFCKIINGGVLKPKKGINLPGMKLTVPSVTEKDLADLEFALGYDISFVALSFVRSAKDITELKAWMKKKGADHPVIAKIEKPEAVKDFDAILAETDGIMVARGDLGVEMPAQDVPVIQKMIINKCNAAGKLVITATQMLESMIKNPIPTRAEASDVANAVWDGTDVVMLSGETSVGKYPEKAVCIMNEILLNTECRPELFHKREYEVPKILADNIFDATGRAIANISDQIGAKLIVVFTHYGRKARVISKFRPKAPIFAVSDKTKTLSRLNLYSGIQSYFMDSIDDEDITIEKAMAMIKKKGTLNKGDIVIFTAGAPFTDDTRRNWMRYMVI